MTIERDGRLLTKLVDSSEEVIYVGYAPVGVAKNAIGWTIVKITKEDNEIVSTVMTQNDAAIWSDRAVEDYPLGE